VNIDAYSIDDLNRYLRRGTGFAEIRGVVTPVYIEKVLERFTEESPRTAIKFAKVYLPRSKGSPSSWESNKPIEIKLDSIDLSPIEAGCYNYKAHAVHIRRGAERQWNMAVNSNSYSSKACNRDNSGISSPSITSPALLKCIKNNRYYDIGTASSRIREGKRYTVALSRKFWLGVDRYSENLLIGYNADNIIGVVKPDDNVVVYKGFEFLMESLSQITPIGGVEDAA